jgi:hypothetical protein
VKKTLTVLGSAFLILSFLFVPSGANHRQNNLVSDGALPHPRVLVADGVPLPYPRIDGVPLPYPRVLVADGVPLPYPRIDGVPLPYPRVLVADGVPLPYPRIDGVPLPYPRFV